MKVYLCKSSKSRISKSRRERDKNVGKGNYITHNICLIFFSIFIQKSFFPQYILCRNPSILRPLQTSYEFNIKVKMTPTVNFIYVLHSGWLFFLEESREQVFWRRGGGAMMKKLHEKLGGHVEWWCCCSLWVPVKRYNIKRRNSGVLSAWFTSTLSPFLGEDSTLQIVSVVFPFFFLLCDIKRL